VVTEHPDCVLKLYSKQTSWSCSESKERKKDGEGQCKTGPDRNGSNLTFKYTRLRCEAHDYDLCTPCVQRLRVKPLEKRNLKKTASRLTLKKDRDAGGVGAEVLNPMLSNVSSQKHVAIKVECHPHTLVFFPKKDWRFGWNCDGRKLEGGCRSKNIGMDTTKRYRCNACDFDLCERCCNAHEVTDSGILMTTMTRIDEVGTTSQVCLESQRYNSKAKKRDIFTPEDINRILKTLRVKTMNETIDEKLNKFEDSFEYMKKAIDVMKSELHSYKNATTKTISQDTSDSNGSQANNDKK